MGKGATNSHIAFFVFSFSDFRSHLAGVQGLLLALNLEITPDGAQGTIQAGVEG